MAICILCVQPHSSTQLGSSRLCYQGNILVDDEEHVKLSDFGISNIANTELSIGTSRPGAEKYMAPEICDPERFGLSHVRHTEKSDVYSVGHLCWKVHHPFTCMPTSMFTIT